MALSEDSSKFFSEVLTNSLPNQERPRLAPEIEAKFENVDAQSRVAYSDMEIAAKRFRELAEAIDDKEKNPDGIVEEAIESDNDSVVNHIEVLKAAVVEIPTTTDTTPKTV